MTAKIFIDGEHGTTGLQIRTRLAGRRDIDLLSIPEAERRNAAMREDMLNNADISILCLPDDASGKRSRWWPAITMSASSIPRPPIASIRTGPMALPKWIRNRARRFVPPVSSPIRAATRPARSPFCARCAPRMLPDGYPVSVNAVSGYTGGGKQMIAQMEDQSRDDAISANNFLYGLTLKHKHVPEMTIHGQLDRAPLFSPSVGRFRRA